MEWESPNRNQGDAAKYPWQCQTGFPQYCLGEKYIVAFQLAMTAVTVWLIKNIFTSAPV